jgi:Cytochrome c3
MTFAGARVDHARLTGRPCATCHNRVTAEGKPNGHLATTASCETCHNTLLWTSVTYRHVSPAYVNHGPGVDCTGCHAGKTQAVAWKFPAFRLSCAGCHVDRYRPIRHVKLERPVKTYYALSELRDCAGACHVYADSTMRKVVQHNVGRHRPGAGGW